ncbi:UPF0223 family protein [Salicibibacter kimchii]|uniref:Uncharacterized protein n=1 Tax=Salicibibacter kimchii TaxID=2099786 RepID=A0A345BX36_9BACI|nr:UPF0223 family protein [Salicibibacter kimchii]AXF55517.1 hypothetical protein DT065_05435 [Salicibibacter kimchii]
MKDEVAIPFSTDWSKDEIVTVANFFTQVDNAYKAGVKAGELLNAYKQFKEVVPAKNEEKSYFRDYDQQAGQSCWRTVRLAKEKNPEEIVRQT